MSTGHFFQNGGQARKMQKKSFFFAEMAYIHVGTEYIKRPWDFENFLEFWCTLSSSSRGEWLCIKAGDWQFAGVGVGGEWLDIKAGDWQLAGLFNEARSPPTETVCSCRVHCQIYLKGAFWVGCILWQAGQRRGGFELGYIRGKLCEAVTTQLGWMVVGTFIINCLRMMITFFLGNLNWVWDRQWYIYL